MTLLVSLSDDACPCAIVLTNCINIDNLFLPRLPSNYIQLHVTSICSRKLVTNSYYNEALM